MNRIDAEGKKINIPLDIQEVVTCQKRQYRLKSFLVHEGEEVGAGHYLAFSFAEDGSARLFDDGGKAGMPEYREATSDEFRDSLSKSYILFYEIQTSEELTPVRTPLTHFNALHGTSSPTSETPKRGFESSSPAFKKRFRCFIDSIFLFS